MTWETNEKVNEWITAFSFTSSLLHVSQLIVNVNVVELWMLAVTESCPCKVMVYVPFDGFVKEVEDELPHADIARPAAARTMIHAGARNLRA